MEAVMASDQQDREQAARDAQEQAAAEAAQRQGYADEAQRQREGAHGGEPRAAVSDAPSDG
jgi:hypothetical protein